MKIPAGRRGVAGSGGRIAAGMALVLLAVVVVSSCRKKPPQETAQQGVVLHSGSLEGLSSAAAAAPGALHVVMPTENVTFDGGGDSYAHVTYTPAVKMFSLEEIQSTLEGISSDGQGFVFQNAPAAIRALAPGDILFVKDQLAAKVLGNATDGDTTLLLVGEAPLREVVADGEINIDAPLHFHAAQQAAESAPPLPGGSFLDALIPPVYAAQSGLQGSGFDAARQKGTQDAAQNAAKSIANAIVDGWKIVQWSATPGDNQMNFQVVLSKDSEGFVAMIAMKGWISNTDFVSHIKIGQGMGSSAFRGVKNTKGNIQFDWEIGKASPGVWAKEERVKLPAALSVPLAPLVGGLPLTLDFSAALLIHPALTGGNEYSRGGFAVSWGNGNLETSSTGGAVSDGNTIETTYNVTADQNISPVAPNAMVVSFCAPRIELKLDVLGKLAKSVTTLGSRIDSIEKTMMSHMPQSVQDAFASSPLSKVTANNILTSNADIYIQFITTEGVTHSASETPMPCSKQEIKLTAEGGGDAQLFGLTPGMKTTTELFTKTFTRWDPASDFCKNV